jgi:GxxExxY protein
VTQKENEIAKAVVDVAYKIHTTLGPGLLETVYQVVLAHELRKRGYHVQREKSISFNYEDITFEEGFRADLVVDDSVIIELKSVEHISPAHKKQLLTYLRLTGMRLGLLINFAEELIKNGITRMVNNLPEENKR